MRLAKGEILTIKCRSIQCFEYTYGLITIMHATGVIASIPGLLNFTKYSNNLMWTAAATLGALVALFLLRNWDNLFSLSKDKNELRMYLQQYYLESSSPNKISCLLETTNTFRIFMVNFTNG